MEKYSQWRKCLDCHVRGRLYNLFDRSAESRQVSSYGGWSVDDSCFLSLGHNRQLVSDLGPEFQNDIIKQLCRMLHVMQLTKTSYLPNAYGKVEQVHRSLNSLMAKVVSDSHKDWSSVLSLCVLAYNMCKSETISLSPCYLTHGREAICPLDLL